MAKALTPRQIRFVQLYVQSGNATKAARQAGYHGDDNSLAAVASRMLRNAKIAAFVEDAQKDVLALYASENYRNFLRELDLAQNAESEPVRLAAIKDMLDRGGLKPTDKIEHGGQMEVQHGVDTAGANALLAALGFGPMGTTQPRNAADGGAGDSAPTPDSGGGG